MTTDPYREFWLPVCHTGAAFGLIASLPVVLCLNLQKEQITLNKIPEIGLRNFPWVSPVSFTFFVVEFATAGVELLCSQSDPGKPCISFNL